MALQQWLRKSAKNDALIQGVDGRPRRRRNRRQWLSRMFDSLILDDPFAVVQWCRRYLKERERERDQRLRDRRVANLKTVVK